MSKTQHWVHAEALALTRSPVSNIIDLDRAVRTIRFNLTWWCDTRCAMHIRISHRGMMERYYPRNRKLARIR
jgi:hypothetical protein